MRTRPSCGLAQQAPIAGGGDAAHAAAAADDGAFQDKKLIAQNLETAARDCQWLVLWLDCDREGENIAFEVGGAQQLGTGCPLPPAGAASRNRPTRPASCAAQLPPRLQRHDARGQPTAWMTAGGRAAQVIDVCRKANRRLVVKRARFSALIPRELERAVAQLVEPNQLDALAVDARQEIDLRIGASFTRLQTLLLQVGVGGGGGGGLC
jgi:DNA topoisomerase IA